ncbi:MAG: D-alanine--D-alanine ligase [Spirochaetota bacterium]
MDNGKIVILHSPINEASDKDELDISTQVRVISSSLKELGYNPLDISLPPDLDGIAPLLKKISPLCVFNLVESMHNTGRHIHLVPAFLDYLGIKFTGCPTEAVFVTSNKLLAKRIMVSDGIPTPPWSDFLDNPDAGLKKLSPPFILKTVWEHASIGITDDSVLTTVNSVKQALVGNRTEELFLESYIEGREFNLSLISSETGFEILPPAEIQFLGFPDTKPKLVGYRAKWDETSFEYHNTPRRFDFPEDDRRLIETLMDLSTRCWRRFGLRGYARVDFRVDNTGHPFVLEVNTNPCLSPDAGFLAAAAAGGLSPTQVISRILAQALF